MADMKEDVMDWLRDAHAMEQQAEQMLAATARRVEHYPEFKARIEAHLEETRQQAQRLTACMESLGADNSVIKDMTGRLAAGMQGMGAAMASDEIVKLAIASYHFEHLEIASYRSLIAAAEVLQDTRLRDVFASNLREEEAMAAWLADWIPTITRTYLARSAGDAETAKR